MSSVNPFEQNVDIYNKKISSSKTINTNQSSEVSESAQIDTSGSIYSESSDSKQYSNGLSIENDSEIDSNTYNVIKEQLENEIEQKKQALQDKKDDRGWATSLWNGAKELFGGGDKAELKEIEKLEEELKTLETEPDNLDAVYKSIMGKDLSAEEISKIKNSSSLVSSLDSSTKQAIITELENQYEQIEDSLDSAKSSNGWISGAWDKFKNWTGIGASSNKSETQLDNMKEQLDSLKENPDNLAEVYKNITGKDFTTDELNKFISGETSLVSESKAAESVSKYSEGQKMATDIVADVVSGIAAVGAIAAAPFTGGASLLLAAGVGAGVKVGLKASDCIGNEKTYGLSDLAYDSVTGSINGLFAPISNGLGGAAGTGVAKAFGLEAAENTVKTALKQTAKTVGKEAAEEVLEQGAKQAGKSTISKILAKQGTEYVLKEGAESTLKTTIGKVAAYGTDMVVDGALSGATDGLARALGEGRIEDIPQDILNGLAGGAVASPLIGGGFRLATKGGSKIGNMIGKSDIGDSVADEVSDKSKSSFLNKAGELKNAASDKLHQAGDKIKNSNAYQKAGELKDAAKNKFHQMTKENKVSKDSIIPSPDETQIDGQLAFADAAPSSGSIKNVDETIAQTGDNAQIPGQMTLDDLVNKPESDITEKRSLLSKITTLKNKIKTKITDKQIQKIKTHLNTDQDYIKAAQKLGIDTSYWKKFRGGELNDLLKNDIIAIKLGKNAEKTFVPKFSSADDAISKLKVGDICQIADTGKISIKTADGSLKTLKLSPQKYLELFPPISRYAMEQKYIGDCYLIASLDIMNKTPETRANLLECFTENADGSVTVKIPKGKISQTFAADKTAEDYVSNNFFSIRISEQRSGKKSDFIINGPEGMKMLEYTYGLNLLDDEIDKLQSELYDSSRCINNQQKNVDYYSDILSTFGDKSVDVDLLRKKIEKYNIDGFYQHFTEQTENGIKLNLKRIKEVSLRMDGDKKECLTAILEMGDNPDFDFIEKKWLQFNSQSIDETIEKMILPDGTINADYINGSIQNAESIINELGESTDKIQKQILDLTQKNPSETAEALRDKGGMMYKVFEKFGIEADRTYYQPEKVKELLHDPENFDKYIFGGGTPGKEHDTYWNEELGISQHHAHSIKPFISESGEYLYRVTNPWNTAQSSVLTYDQIKEYFDSIYFARIKN